MNEYFTVKRLHTGRLDKEKKLEEIYQKYKLTEATLVSKLKARHQDIILQWLLNHRPIVTWHKDIIDMIPLLLQDTDGLILKINQKSLSNEEIAQLLEQYPIEETINGQSYHSSQDLTHYVRLSDTLVAKVDLVKDTITNEIQQYFDPILIERDVKND